MFLPLAVMFILTLAGSYLCGERLRREAGQLYDAIAFNLHYESLNLRLQGVLLDISPAAVSAVTQQLRDDSLQRSARLDGLYRIKLDELTELISSYVSEALTVHGMYETLSSILSGNHMLSSRLQKAGLELSAPRHFHHLANYGAGQAVQNILNEIHVIRGDYRRLDMLCSKPDQRSATTCRLYAEQVQRVNLLEAEAVVGGERLRIAHGRLLKGLMELNNIFAQADESAYADREQVLSAIGDLPGLGVLFSVVFMGLAVIYFLLFQAFFIQPVRRIAAYIAAHLQGLRPAEAGRLSYTGIRELNEIIALVRSVLDEHAHSQQENASLRQENHDIFVASRQDALTGALNRRALDEFAADHPVAPQGFAVLMVDIDFFKKLNDRLGHQMGDEVLRQVSHTLSSGLRESDRLYRYGGEEFCACLSAVSEAQAAATAARLNAAVAALQISGPTGAEQVTVSIGVACADTADGTAPGIDSLVAQADAALYAAKRGGRNRYVLSSALTEGGPA